MERDILVCGSNDVASAVAHRLHSAGCRVAMHDPANPAFARRKMAFTDAWFEHYCTLAGVSAKRARLESLGLMLDCRRAVPIVSDAIEAVVATLSPSVFVDARMLKRQMHPDLRDRADLTIGLGPNFVAGENVHVAVETQWGPELGMTRLRGANQALAGEPRNLGGMGRERIVYAPVTGKFVTTRRIGDEVRAGDPVGNIGGTELPAPASGRLRGLTRNGVAVCAGAKVIEVDPRPEAVYEGLGERPMAIAAGVLMAILGVSLASEAIES